MSGYKNKNTVPSCRSEHSKGAIGDFAGESQAWIRPSADGPASSAINGSLEGASLSEGSSVVVALGAACHLGAGTMTKSPKLDRYCIWVSLLMGMFGAANT